VNNQRMARGLGINVDVLFAITFALGSGLAGLGGALAVAMVGLDPSFAFTYLIYVLIVVSVGGLGSIAGSLAAAMVLARALAGIGWVAQEREIFTTLTVEENLNVAAHPGRWDLAAIYDLFPRLAERRRNLGNQLSGGEQQMLAIARALMTNPALLLLDEPLEGLAPIVVEELAAAIRRMTSEGTCAFILVEQHAEIALSLTQSALLLERGRVVHSGPSAQLLEDHATLDRYIGLRLAEV